MNNLKSAMIRNVLASCLAVAVLAVMGVGQVQAQATSDDASVPASITIFEPLQIEATGDLAFGNQTPSAGSISINPDDGATFTITSGSTWDGNQIEVTYPTSPTFTDGNGNSLSWSPNVQLSNGTSVGSGTTISSESDTETTLEVGASTNLQNQAPGDYSDTFTLSVAYTNL